MTKQIDVTAAIIVKNGKVFAARRKEGMHLAGYWEFPGGKLESGETPDQCLERELEEEFLITTHVGPYVGESIYDYGSKIVRLMAFQVEHVSGEFQLIDHDELSWLDVDELDSVNWAPADIPLVEQYRALSKTLAYYDNHSESYCLETGAMDVQHLYKPFLDCLSENAHILDLGCGSGRDSKEFLSRGYRVTAVDGSAEVAAYAEKTIGQPVLVTTFQSMKFEDEFDGVWACASLLHCPKGHMKNVLERVVGALKERGVAYLSFKLGEDQLFDDQQRYFNNYTENTLRSLIDSVKDLSIIDLWRDSTSLRGTDQEWVNLLVKKDGAIT